MTLTKDYAVDTEEANSAILGRFTISPREGESPEAREQREEALYREYETALDTGEIPHAETIKAAFQLLASARSPRIRKIVDKLRKRRILIVFQDRLGTSEVNAFGHLFRPGDRRTVVAEGEEGASEEMDVLKNGAIKISTDFVGSSIGAAAILAHELAHVVEAENGFNGIPPPGTVDVGDGTVSSSEQWADYFAGETLDALGFDENAILEKPRHDLEWGPRWAETYGVLRGMHQLYRAVRKGKVVEDETLWSSLRSTTMIEAFLGAAMTFSVAHSLHGERTEVEQGGVAEDAKKHCNGTFSMFDPTALRWQGRQLTVDAVSDLGQSVTARGEVDASGQYLLFLEVSAVFLETRVCKGGSYRFRLKNIPLVHVSKSPQPVFSYELYGPPAGRHTSGLAGSYARKEVVSAGNDGQEPQICIEEKTLQSVDWSGSGYEPYVQVIFSRGYTERRRQLVAAKEGIET